MTQVAQDWLAQNQSERWKDLEQFVAGGLTRLEAYLGLTYLCKQNKTLKAMLV